MQTHKMVTSLALGLALTGVGLASGMVVNNLPSQVTTANAAQWIVKQETRTLKVPIVKANKKSTITLKNKKFNVNIDTKDGNGAYADVSVPKYKGFQAMKSSFRVFFNDTVGSKILWIVPIHYFKTTTAPKSAKKVTSTASVSYFKSNTPNNSESSEVKLSGVPGYIVKVAAPTIKGYTPSVKTISYGVLNKADSNSYFEQIGNDIKYTKNQGFKVSTLTAKKAAKSSNLKVTGKVAISHASLAKQHKATYAVISDYKGKTYIKLSKKNTFSKTIKNRKGAKHVSAVAAYRTKTTKNGKSTYAYHTLANKKTVAVKTTK